MEVWELIECLQKMDPSLEVLIDQGWADNPVIHLVEIEGAVILKS